MFASREGVAARINENGGIRTRAARRTRTCQGVVSLIVLPTSKRSVARSMKLKTATSTRRPTPSACATSADDPAVRVDVAHVVEGRQPDVPRADAVVEAVPVHVADERPAQLGVRRPRARSPAARRGRTRGTACRRRGRRTARGPATRPSPRTRPANRDVAAAGPMPVGQLLHRRPVPPGPAPCRCQPVNSATPPAAIRSTQTPHSGSQYGVYRFEPVVVAGHPRVDPSASPGRRRGRTAGSCPGRSRTPRGTCSGGRYRLELGLRTCRKYPTARCGPPRRRPCRPTARRSAYSQFSPALAGGRRAPSRRRRAPGRGSRCGYAV